MLELLSHHYESIDSTNNAIIDHIKKAKNPKNTLLRVSADQQTHGKGQHGKSFISQRGNIFTSYAFFNHSIASTLSSHLAYDLTGISLRLGLVVRGFLQAHTQQAVMVKWPNDIIVNSSKTAGILIENQYINNQNWIILGIGINIHNAPIIQEKPTTCLIDHSNKKHLDLPELQTQLDQHMLSFVNNLTSRDSTLNWQKEFENHHFISKGATLDFLYQKTEKKGYFQGIDPHGALLISIDGKKHAFHNGEIKISI